MNTRFLFITFLLCMCGQNIHAENDYELTPDERESIEQHVIEKINDFLSYLPEIAAKSNKSKEVRQLALKYIDKTLDLFIGEGNDYQYQDQAGVWRWHEAVKMQTTSRGKINPPKPMKRYLNSLMALPYQTVMIDTCRAVRIDKNLHPTGDGRYVGSAIFIQAFRATMDGKIVVNDKDAKQVTILVKPVDVPLGAFGETIKKVWIVKLGDIRVTTDWSNE